MRNRSANCTSPGLFCTGDAERLGAPNSQAQTEPRIGSLAKIAITEKALTELQQGPGSLFQSTMTFRKVSSFLPDTSLGLCSQGKRKCSPYTSHGA